MPLRRTPSPRRTPSSWQRSRTPATRPSSAKHRVGPVRHDPGSVTAAASPAPGGATAAAATGRRRPWLADGRLFILPAIVLLILMSIGPAVYLFGTSLFDFHLLRPEQSTFVGLGNYIDALTSIQTWDRLWNTVIFVTIAVSIEVVLGVGLALLL